MIRIYVGSLPFDATETDLRGLFEPHGAIRSARVITDKDTGRSRGFGFVEMDSDDEARKAIKEVNGSEVKGRRIIVNEAKPRPEPGAAGAGRGPGGPGRRGVGGGGEDGEDRPVILPKSLRRPQGAPGFVPRRG